MLLVKNRKFQFHHWILHIRDSLGTKFQVKMTVLIFWTKFLPKKSVFVLNHKKSTPPLNAAYGNYSWHKTSAYTNNFNFSDQTSWKRVFLIENWKNQHHHWSLHIQISLQSILKYLRQTLLFMWNSALQQKFNFCIPKIFLLALTNFLFWEEH